MSSSTSDINELLNMEPPPPPSPAQLGGEMALGKNGEIQGRPQGPPHSWRQAEVSKEGPFLRRKSATRTTASSTESQPHGTMVSPRSMGSTPSSSPTSQGASSNTQQQRQQHHQDSGSSSPRATQRLRSLPSFNTIQNKIQGETSEQPSIVSSVNESNAQQAGHGSDSDSEPGEENHQKLQDSEGSVPNEESALPEDFKNLKVRYSAKAKKKSEDKPTPSMETTSPTRHRVKGLRRREDGQEKSRSESTGEAELEGASTLIPPASSEGPKPTPSRHAAQLKNIERQIQRYVRSRSGEKADSHNYYEDVSYLKSELIRTRLELQQTKKQLEESVNNFSARRARFIALEREMQQKVQSESEKHQKQIQELKQQLDYKKAMVKSSSHSFEELKKDFTDLQTEHQTVKRKLHENEVTLESTKKQVQKLNSQVESKDQIISRLRQENEQLRVSSSNKINHGEKEKETLVNVPKESRGCQTKHITDNGAARFLYFQFSMGASPRQQRRYSCPSAITKYDSLIPKVDAKTEQPSKEYRASHVRQRSCSVAASPTYEGSDYMLKTLTPTLLGAISEQVRKLRKMRSNEEEMLQAECDRLREMLAKKTNEVKEACDQVNESWKQKVSSLRDTVRRDIAYRESKHKEEYQKLENQYNQLSETSESKIIYLEDCCKQLEAKVEQMKEELSRVNTCDHGAEPFARERQQSKETHLSPHLPRHKKSYTYTSPNHSMPSQTETKASAEGSSSRCEEVNGSGSDKKKDAPLTPLHVEHLIRGLDTTALKKCLSQAGIPFHDCFEKAELQDRLMEAATRGLTKMYSPQGSDSNASTPTHRENKSPPQHRPSRLSQKRHSASAAAQTPSATEACNSNSRPHHDEIAFRQRKEEEELRRRQQARLEQYKEEAKKAEADAEERDRISRKVETRIKKWSFRKSLREMLMTLNSVLSGWDVPKAIAAGAKTADSHGALKKVYLKAIRIVHPDKVRSSDITSQVQAHKVFAALNEAWANFEAEVTQKKRPKVPPSQARDPRAGEFGRAPRRYRSSAAPRYHSSRSRTKAA